MANQRKPIKQKAKPKSIWEAIVLRKSYEPSLYFMWFKTGTAGSWIDWQIAYNQADAERLAVEQFRAEQEKELKDPAQKDKASIKKWLDAIELRDYKCGMSTSIRLVDLLDRMDEYFTFEGEDKPLGERVLDKLKNNEV